MKLILDTLHSMYKMSGAPYVVRPARPRSYLDFENRRQRRCTAIKGVLPGLGVRAAPVAPLDVLVKNYAQFKAPRPASANRSTSNNNLIQND